MIHYLHMQYSIQYNKFVCNFIILMTKIATNIAENILWLMFRTSKSQNLVKEAIHNFPVYMIMTKVAFVKGQLLSSHSEQ